VQLAQAQALLLIGTPSNATTATVNGARALGMPVFEGRLEPDSSTLAAWRGRRVLAFAVIGDPEKFFATLQESGIAVAARQGFPDHHRYSRADAQALLARAARDHLLLVTTEKDLARMRGENDLVELARTAEALPVSLRIEAGETLRGLLPANGAISSA